MGHSRYLLLQIDCAFTQGHPHYSPFFTLIEAGALLAYTISQLAELRALM